eukprot:scaffold271826_cov23-Tisochrysis_lutea.AAC.1
MWNTACNERSRGVAHGKEHGPVLMIRNKFSAAQTGSSINLMEQSHVHKHTAQYLAFLRETITYSNNHSFCHVEELGSQCAPSEQSSTLELTNLLTPTS